MKQRVVMVFERLVLLLKIENNNHYKYKGHVEVSVSMDVAVIIITQLFYYKVSRIYIAIIFSDGLDIYSDTKIHC